MLHITNGEATKERLERSGVPGRFSSWDDILHEGPTALVSGDEWLHLRARYLASAGYGTEADLVESYRAKHDALETVDRHDEVVFWFEHDLYDQLLLIRHLWWIGRAGGATRFSIVMGHEYLGLLEPAAFPSRFQRRESITAPQIQLGTAAWEAFCGDDPERLLRFALPEQTAALPYLAGAMRRLLEEFPAASNGLARSERQILEVLAEGTRTPEQTFIAASRLEEDIWMGDWSFWRIAKGLGAGADPLLAMDVGDRPGRLPDGTLDITPTGRRVLARRADQIALNGISRWIGGTLLTPARCWRWTGSSLRPPAP